LFVELKIISPSSKNIKYNTAADLPVQRSTKVEFVINFKTAKALDIEVPNAMQLLADEGIE
jgi:putative ABC transport system substrate-binding protein